ARFSGGLSVRHFLKTVTSLRCTPGDGFEKARNAAELLARAEGLEGHAQSAVARGLLGIQRPHKTTFDNIADSYEEELKNSLGKYGRRDIAIFAEYKIKIIKSKLFKTPANVLEFGCGTGRNTLFLKKWFPESNIYGCDISEKSLEIASKANPTVQYDKITTPADLFEVYKEPFDCIFISNVFHHIPFNEHQIWLDALYRITSEEGIVFIFEHNPYNPITKRVFSSSEIDKGAFMLKPSYCQKLLQNTNFTNINRRYTLFFLWRNSFFESVERMLYWLPLGAQYYVWGKKCKNLTTSQ
ncbi:MAG: methyltransferase domain-containing protein, partial [Treponema sp.]|nr:methyltransferase domain-containing protein [Treponema sp.]